MYAEGRKPKIVFKFKCDPSLQDGYILNAGGYYLDASLKTKLERMLKAVLPEVSGESLDAELVSLFPTPEEYERMEQGDTSIASKYDAIADAKLKEEISEYYHI